MKKSILWCCVLAASSWSSAGLTDGSFQLEEVVVTAQRKSETLQDAAIAIDASTGDTLNRLGISNANGLSKISPSLTVVNGGGSSNVFFVRGVGNFAVNAYTDAALAFNVDGVFMGRPTATTASFLDVDRVEVLKGPQGTLYGRNATAGAINVLPNKPQLDEQSFAVSAGVGNYGAREIELMANLPLSDQWAARVSGRQVSNDGYNDDGTADTDDKAFRVQLAGSLSERVDVRVSLDHSTTEGHGPGPTFLGTYDFPLAGVSDNANNVPGYNFTPAPGEVSSAHSGAFTHAAQDYYASLQTTPAFTGTEPMVRSYIDNSFTGVAAEINVHFDNAELVVIPAWRKGDLDVLFNVPGFRGAYNQEDHEQTSLEARLSTSTGAIDWIGGLFYFDESVDGLASYNQLSLQSTQTIDQSDTESKAAFLRGTWNVSDQLRVVGALRLTQDKKDFDGRADVILNLCIRDLPVFPGGPEIPNCDGAPVIPVGTTVENTLAQLNAADLPFGAPGIGSGPVPFGQVPLLPGVPGSPAANLLMINPTVIHSTLDTEELTYRLAVEYDITPDSLLYVSFETGYRSGGFGFALGNESFEPEFLDAWTIGSKNRFFDDRLQLNAELFFWDYKDQQASHFGIDATGNTAFFTENIGSSSIQGIEVDVRYALTESTVLSANVQYLDNEIDEFTYDQKTPAPEVAVVTGCESTLTEVIDDEGYWRVDCSGQEGRNSPEMTINVGLQQSYDLGGMRLTANLDARYRDERWVGFDFTPPQRADSVTTIDASLRLSAADESWSLMAYGRNLTDKEIKSSTQVFGAVSNLVSTLYEPPRTYGVRLDYRF